MSGKAFSKIMRGLEEAKAYVEGEREGYRESVAGKSPCLRSETWGTRIYAGPWGSAIADSLRE